MRCKVGVGRHRGTGIAPVEYRLRIVRRVLSWREHGSRWKLRIESEWERVTWRRGERDITIKIIIH